MVDAPIVIGELWTDVQSRNVGKKEEAISIQIK